MVKALGKSWKLHKLYLLQSRYFASLFSGRWAGGYKNVVTRSIVDPCITLDRPARLRELMSQLVSSAHLFVMQTEFSVYVLLRLWMFLQLHPAWDGEPQDALAASQSHFKALHSNSAADYFLQCSEAAPFLSVFRNIRLPHLINHHMDVEMLVSDKIVPDSWMSSTYYARWMTLLRLDCGIDKGPQNLDEETFDRECLRCGQTLNTDGQHIWRWTGFNSGLDLIITYDNYRLTMKVILTMMAI